MNKYQLIFDATEMRKQAEQLNQQAADSTKESETNADDGDNIKAEKAAGDATKASTEAQQLQDKAESYEKQAQDLEDRAKILESEVHDHQARIEVLQQNIAELRGP